MDFNKIEQRKLALNFNKKIYAHIYQNIRVTYPYKEEFIEFILEAYNCFIYGLARASMIMVGEALLRVISDKTIENILNTKSDYIIIHGKKLDNNNIIDEVDFFRGNLTFNDVITFIKKRKLLNSEIINKMYTVKELRNSAAHGIIPVIDEWDPDDGRSRDEFLKIMRDEIELPEGYRIFLNSKRIFYFDCKNYNCSLKGLSYQDKIAAIEFYIVIELLNKIGYAYGKQKF